MANPLPEVSDSTVFGPVIERTLPLSDLGYSFCLNLDSDLITPMPVSLTQADWSLGITLPDGIIVIAPIPDQMLNLAGTGTRVVPLLDGLRAWETLRPSEINVPDGAVSGQTVTVTGERHSPPLTFAFKTAKGTRGLLQITSFTDNPRGVKIRYKLVRDSKANVAPTTSLAPATEQPEATLGPAFGREHEFRDS
jgi:hypothetical protein